jgi:hypothetical protein
MQSLPPSGVPFFSETVSPGKAPPPVAPAQQDRVELARGAEQPLLRPNFAAKSAPEPAAQNPRPWPPGPAQLPRSSALGAMGVPPSATLPLSVAVHLAPQPHDPWDANPTGDGWKVPKNPSRTPVQPRDPFEIPTGTDDLGLLRVVSSAHGRIRALRLQWPEEFQEPAFSAQKAVFQDVLTRLPADVVLHVVAEGLAAAALPGLLAELPVLDRVHIHALHLRSTPDTLYSPMTMWARDAALLLHTEAGTPVLLLPRSFRGDGQVDPQLNRLQIQGTAAAPARLGQALPDVPVRRSALVFEGGDVVANRRVVLVGAHTIARNMTDLRLSKAAVVEQFAAELGLPVLVVDPQPDFHIDLGFTFLDDHTVAVADPGEGMRLVASLPELAKCVRATEEKQLTEKYQCASVWLQSQGYQVVRLPALAGLGLLTPYYTYNNVLIENYPGMKRVYMPTYGVEPLDGAARAVYVEHGFRVVEMPSARLSTRLWGAVRCATGELIVSET